MSNEQRVTIIILYVIVSLVCAVVINGEEKSAPWSIIVGFAMPLLSAISLLLLPFAVIYYFVFHVEKTK